MKPSPPPDNETPDTETTTRDLAPSDEDLMCAIRRGDSRALETLLGRYRGLLKDTILRIVKSHACADDVLQDCLTEVWNHAYGYSKNKGRPTAWLTTLAKRRAVDCMRRQVA